MESPPRLFLCLLLIFVDSLTLSLSVGLREALAPCWTSFDDFDLASPFLAYRTASFLCPPNCLSSLPSTSTNVSVIVEGSFPYSPLSSICLSAIHCGLLNSSTGGSVFISRFYRQDWSNSSTQTIYPFQSSLGSSSNGVKSVNVPSASFSVPANGTSFSYTVRGRGEVAVQRRSAPFPPRSSHVHVGFPSIYSDISPFPVQPYTNFYFIIGGWNGTSYLNDAWYAQPSSISCNRSLSSSCLTADLDWVQLPAAPFTPRSSMQTFIVEVPAMSSFLLYVIGGQVDHRCGLYELGVCSDEVWVLQVDVTYIIPFQTFSLVSANWTSAPSQPADRLPFSSRCDPSVFLVPSSYQRVVLVGGQLSYSDLNCTSPPIAVNEVFINDIDKNSRNLSDWRRDKAAPFSPRRSQQTEDLFNLNAPFTQKRVLSVHPLVGGFSIVNLTRDEMKNEGIRLNALEVFADVWMCTMRSPDEYPGCQWGWSDGMGGSVATTSLPIPTAFGMSAVVRNVDPPAGQRFGGFTAKAAVLDWTKADSTSSLPYSATTFNWTVMLRPFPTSNLTANDLSQQRLTLPLSYLLTDELNDPTSSYYIGTEWIQSSTPWLNPPLSLTTDSVYLPSITTLHPQRHQLAIGPSDSSIFLPMPFSSNFTQRPLFQFSLPRLSPGFDDWSAEVSPEDQPWIICTLGQKTVSGGHSASVFTSDWIQLNEIRCLPPDDPSFLSLLGELEWTPGEDYQSFLPLDSSFSQRQKVVVSCSSHYHFEPPLVRVSEATLMCGPNGLWLDDDLLALRSCVSNPPLNCTPPLIDGGGRYCEPGRPSIESIDLTLSSNVEKPNPLTILNFPVTPDTILRVTGSNFTRPLVVTVGGRKCDSPQLVAPYTRLCYNVTCDGQQNLGGREGSVVLVCDNFADALTCTVPALLGLNLAVLVTSGPSALPAEAVGPGVVSSRIATVSSTPPIIQYLNGYIGATDNLTCTSTVDLVHLFDCPVLTPYNVSICLTAASVHNLELIVTLGVSTAPLQCSELSQSAVPFPIAGRCLTCLVNSFLGSRTLRVRPSRLDLQSSTDASISSSSCPPGLSANYRAEVDRTNSSLCTPCEPGSSTRGAKGSPECYPCAVGEFSSEEGSPTCSSCEAGTFSNATGLSSCSQCPTNSYQPVGGQGGCVECESGKYVVYRNSSTRAQGRCTDCPPDSTCDSSAIVAGGGTFLIADQRTGSLTSLDCAASACLNGRLTQCATGDSLTLSLSSLSVLNCCGRGRYPAYTENWQDVKVLQATEGVNVLCALCLPNHTQMLGECVECPSIRWSSLSLVIALGLLLVYVVHRVPHDWSGVATMSILAYFIQQSQLFLSSNPLFQVLATVNLDVLGVARKPMDVGGGGGGGEGGIPDWCIVPMQTDTARIMGSVVTLPLAFVLLGLIGAGHWLAYQLMRRWAHSERATHLFSFVFLAAPPSPPAIRPFLRRTGSERTRMAMSELSQPLSPFSDGEVDRSTVEMEGGEEKSCGGWPGSATAQINLRSSSPLTSPRAGDAPQPLCLCFGEAAPAVAVRAPPPIWLIYQRSVLRLTQLSYTALALLSLRFFHVRSVGQYGSRLVEYPGLSTTDSSYAQLLPVMSIGLILSCAFPLLIAVFLIQQHRGGLIAKLKEEKEDFNVSLQIPSSMAPWQSALTLQLCSMFRAPYWWMASFIPIRRLLLVTVLVVSSEAQVWVWLTFLNQTFLALHLILLPYQRLQDNTLEALTLLSLSLQTTVLSLWPLEANSPALLGPFNALIAAPLLLLLGMKGLETWKQKTKSKKRVQEEELHGEEALEGNEELEDDRL